MKTPTDSDLIEQANLEHKCKDSCECNGLPANGMPDDCLAYELAKRLEKESEWHEDAVVENQKLHARFNAAKDRIIDYCINLANSAVCEHDDRHRLAKEEQSGLRIFAKEMKK